MSFQNGKSGYSSDVYDHDRFCVSALVVMIEESVRDGVPVRLEVSGAKNVLAVTFGPISSYVRAIECSLDQFRDFMFTAHESLFGKMNVIYELKSGDLVPILVQQ